jgi:hypothetical protein
MKKLLGVLMISGAAVLATFSTSDSSAQTKKAKNAANAPVGTIELKQGKDEKFRFTIRDADGKYLGGSTIGHATDKEAKDACEELKTVIMNAKYVTIPKK